MYSTDFIKGVNRTNFNSKALEVFRYQYQENQVYRAFTDALGVRPGDITRVGQIPFLPISFFRSHKVICGNAEPILVFESSGTTAENKSRHYVTDAGVYKKSLLQGFEQFYGNPSKYSILALLPGYLERSNSSLVHMAKVLMEQSNQPFNGFYLNEFEKLRGNILQLQEMGLPAILLGVTFALLDFAEAHPMDLQNIIVMETGGMKGRREEWTRTQVHGFLSKQWNLKAIHSEYGMTELLTQAYSKGDGIFEPSATMKVLTRDVNDPLEIFETGSGCLNIIDLANVNSCSFIATEDMGFIHPDGRFEVLGRADHSLLRGCSLMTA